MKFIRKSPTSDGVEIIIMAPKEHIEKKLGAMSQEEYEQYANNHKEKFGKDCRVIEDSEIPTTRHYRDAWRLSENRLEINKSASKEIALSRIRANRLDLLDNLDKKIQAAQLDNEQETLESLLVIRRQLLDSTEAIKALSEESLDVSDLENMEKNIIQINKQRIKDI